LTVPLNPPPNQISSIRIVWNDVVITAPSIFSMNYQLQYREPLTAGNWVDRSGAFDHRSIGGPITLTEVGGASNTWRFYRVRVFSSYD
jgi:hypothetical protein